MCIRDRAYTILLYATKYIFFFFASARYLYLILLEIVTQMCIRDSLKAFEQPLSDEQLKSITERFDLTKYEANPAGYRENGLHSL